MSCVSLLSSVLELDEAGESVPVVCVTKVLFGFFLRFLGVLDVEVDFRSRALIVVRADEEIVDFDIHGLLLVVVY